MKILVSRKKQILSFLPVEIAMNDSLYTSLQIDKSAGFNTETPMARFSLRLFRMKRSFEFDIQPEQRTTFEMYFNLDQHQSLLIILGFVAAIFLLISGILNENTGNVIIASCTFIVIFLVSLCHSMQLVIKGTEMDQ
jgi:hypothetical protein